MIEVFKNQRESIMKFEHKKSKCDFQPNKTPNSEILSKNLSSKDERTKISESQIIATLNSQFYLIKKIGKGAYGSVYLSYSIKDTNKLKNFYAIKIIEHKDQNGNFINDCEVNFLEKMNHKNILKVYVHGLDFWKHLQALKLKFII